MPLFNMARTDLLQENLRSIFVSLGGDSTLNPPPDCLDTLGWWLSTINNQIATGGETGTGEGGVSLARLTLR